MHFFNTFGRLLMPSFSQYVWVLVVVGVLLSGCRKKRELANWDVDVTAPIAYGAVDLSDVAANENLVESQGQLLNLVFSDTLINLGLDTLIGIPDTTITEGFTLPIDIPSVPGSPFYQDVKTSQYQIRGAKLTYAIVRDSELRVKLTNTIDRPVLFTYTVLSATLNGDTFEVQQRVEAKSTLDTTYNMNGYALDLRGLTGAEYNTIVSRFSAMIHPSVTDTVVTIKAGAQFSIENTVKNVIPEYIQGYFGNHQITFNESEPIELLDRFPFESLNITDFDVTMTIDNGMGVDLSLIMTRLGSSNTDLGTSSELNHSLIGSNLEFTRAQQLYDPADPVRHITKEVQFTDVNSNLDELLEIRPNEFVADMDIEVNPLGNISLGNDFVFYGHNLRAIMDLRIPLILGLKGLQLNDTVEVNYTAPADNSPIHRVNEGVLRFIFDNGFPFEAGVQFYLQDSAGNEFDSLLTNVEWIEGALEEANGRVLQSQQSFIEVPVDQQKLDHLEQAEALRLNVELNTTGTDSVHVRSNYQLGYRLVGEFNANIRE